MGGWTRPRKVDLSISNFNISYETRMNLEWSGGNPSAIGLLVLEIWLKQDGTSKFQNFFHIFGLKRLDRVLLIYLYREWSHSKRLVKAVRLRGGATHFDNYWVSEMKYGQQPTNFKTKIFLRYPAVLAQEPQFPPIPTLDSCFSPSNYYACKRRDNLEVTHKSKSSFQNVSNWSKMVKSDNWPIMVF